MAASETTFGRRREPSAAAPREIRTAQGLSPQAEAFRASLRADPGIAPDDFAAWRRAQRLPRLMAWIGGLALMSPGLLCFLFHAPLSVSIGLEVAGGLANAWLRRERQRHLRAITTWTSPDEG